MTVARASGTRISVPTTDASLAGMSDAARRTDLRAGAAAPVKVVFAAAHKPVLAWQTVVTGTEKDGTPIRDLVYTDAKTGKQLARIPQVMDATGAGNSLYSGSVALQTVLSDLPAHRHHARRALDVRREQLDQQFAERPSRPGFHM